MDVIQKFNLYHTAFIENYEICWAGAIVMKKTNKVETLIKKWLDICCNENNLTDLKSFAKQFEYFHWLDQFAKMPK